MDKALRFAIIGCGKIAPRHAEQMVKYGHLIAVCDIDKEKADAFAMAYNSSAFYSVDDLINSNKEIDIAAICTPNGLHATHSIQMLKSGANVLCEKPLCISAPDGEAMINASKQVSKKLFVVKSTRYNPSLIDLKKNIEKLGQLYSFQLNCFWNRPPSYYHSSWKGTNDMDGGTLYTQFSHYIDAMLWLFGDVADMKGFRKNYTHRSIIEFEDSGVVSLQMKNGMIGGLNWSVNTFQKNMEVSMTIIAEKGSIRIGGEFMNKVEYQLTNDILIQAPQEGNANDYGYYKGSMSNHDKVYENLLVALKDESHPFSYAEDGLKTVETIQRIYNCVSLS